MPERLSFERELSALGLRETETFEEWQRKGRRLDLDFFDRFDAHLAYLGDISMRWHANARERRLISRTDLTDIFKANPLSDPSQVDYAFSGTSTRPEDKLFPETVGRQPAFNRSQIGEQARQQSLLLQVDDPDTQKRVLDGLLAEAKRTKREQGSYIVVEVNNTQNTARLFFLPATPRSASGEDFVFNIAVQSVRVGRRVIRTVYVPGAEPKPGRDSFRQVIGTIHTHFLEMAPSVAQTTTTGTTQRPDGTTERRIVHAVSTLDINSAKDNQIVVYALEAKNAHRALPDGTFQNNRPRWPDMLMDALNAFSGRAR